MIVNGVAFKSVHGWMFVSDGEPLVYRWLPKRGFWGCVGYRPDFITEAYVLEVHSKVARRIGVRLQKLNSGVKYR